MKVYFPLPFHVLLLASWTYCAPAAVLTVTTADNNSGPSDGLTSLDEALRAATDGDVVRFNIPGNGPHLLVTPLGGYPLITANNLLIDGYSQPGASPNTNPILGGNNARIKIVLDSTGTDSAPNPVTPTRPLRRSTRLDFPGIVGNTGYGERENAILGVYAASNFTVRGLCFLGRRTPGDPSSDGEAFPEDPVIYGVALVRRALNARIQGCWFGLPPDGSTQAHIRPVSSAVAAFRWRVGGDVFSEGAIIGTDGDGANDRAEFNIIAGCHIGLALELPRAKISGNYFNVFPDGLSFVNIDAVHTELKALNAAFSVENIENGRLPAGTVIGTNGDGVSDSDERNIFGHVVYTHGIEFYTSCRNVVLAGNYFGVGIDGITPAPVSTNIAPDFGSFAGVGEIRVGSNGDGVSDDLEGNLIVNVRGARFIKFGAQSPIVCRQNRMVNCDVSAVPFGNGEGAPYTGYYTPYLLDPFAGVSPVLQRLDGGILSGRMPLPSSVYPHVLLDLHLVDPLALQKRNFWPVPMTHPQICLASFTDNGSGDLNPAPGEFAFNIAGLGLSETDCVAMTASYSAQPGRFNATEAVTSPMSNPISARPVLLLKLPGTGTVELSWFAPAGMYVPQLNNFLNDPSAWTPFPATSIEYHGGRNVVITGYDYFSEGVFFRLVRP